MYGTLRLPIGRRLIKTILYIFIVLIIILNYWRCVSIFWLFVSFVLVFRLIWGTYWCKRKRRFTWTILLNRGLKILKYLFISYRSRVFGLSDRWWCRRRSVVFFRKDCKSNWMDRIHAIPHRYNKKKRLPNNFLVQKHQKYNTIHACTHHS